MLFQTKIILPTNHSNGQIAAATVNWVTQTSFDPPLIAVGVKTDSGAHSIIKESGVFALNFLTKNQQSTAFAFFKPTEKDGDIINGEAYKSGSTDSPILTGAKAYFE